MSGSVSERCSVAQGTTGLLLGIGPFCSFHTVGPAPGEQPVFLPRAEMSGAAPAFTAMARIRPTIQVSRNKERVLGRASS